MKCAHCDLENPAVARFCGGCGAPLEVVCGACRAANPPGNRFCHQCGAPLTTTAATGPFASPRAYTPKHLAEKILTTSAALTGERKQVTVLFVDVSGFTSLSERLDPEEVHRLMSRAFDLMLAAVHRYEGTVNQFLGDGIMALFGAPIAHEDHARRAVHAALGITAALEGYQKELAARGISFRVRQGLNTGLVVVGSIGSDLRMDYTAVGGTTNVAARLQQLSEPGQVTISEATHRLIHGFFETRPLGTMHLKGRTEPLAVWHVVAAHEGRTRLEVEADRGLTPFIGRERELNLLQESFARARSGQGQVVFVVGEPGIGKSRLVHELRQRLGPQADWLEGHCLSFGRAMTFHPLVDLIRRWCGVKEGDGDGVIAAKIDHAVATYGLDVSSITPYLRALLSVDPGDAEVRGMTPAQRRGETFDALRRLLVRAAERRPQVLVIEDLHWIDSTSEQFLTALVVASALQWAEDLPAALEQTREAIAIAEPIGAAAPLSGAFFVRDYVESVSGRLDAAEADLGRAYDIARTVQDANRQALALHLLGLRRSWQGDYQGGRTLNDQGTRIARQHRLVIPLLRCLWVRGLVSSELGEYDPALAEFAEGLMLAEKIGDDAFVPRFLNTIGWLRLECGDFAQGMELSERAYELTNRSSRAGHGTGAERRAFIRNNEADALMARGDLAGAAAALEEAEHIVRHPPPSRWMTWRYGSHCYAALGQLALLNADPGRARRMADQALEMATPTGSRKYESWAWRLKGESATAERVWDEAEQALGRALTIAQTIGHVRQTWMSEVALGRLYTARGRQQDARRHYDAAWTTISGIRVRTQDPGLQIGLDSSPVSREVEGVVKSE